MQQQEKRQSQQNGKAVNKRAGENIKGQENLA
jgi:hypothetical protein